jgi:hypothetical protein
MFKPPPHTKFLTGPPILEPADIRRRNDLVIGANGFLAAFRHQPPPSKHQARREPMAAGNIADRHPRLHRLRDNSQLLLGRETPPSGDAGDDLDPGKHVGHRHSPRSIPGSSG